MALIGRNGNKIVNEPHAGGGNPIVNNDKILFNDVLGTTLGEFGEGGYSAVDKTSFGADSKETNSFFTGKPYVEDLGYTFLFRNYRPDTGKWLSSDLLGYPDGWNNLAYCNNSVIANMDLFGALIVVNPNTSSDWQTKTNKALNDMKSTPSGKALYDQLNNSKNVHVITEGSINSAAIIDPSAASNGQGSDSVVIFNPDITSTEGWERPAWAGLGHELLHSGDADNGVIRTGETDGIPNFEIDAVNGTNEMLKESGFKGPLRNSYGGKPLPE